MVLPRGSVTGRALECGVEVRVLAWTWEMEIPACFRLPIHAHPQMS